jgi:lysophospholipid hydrolase
MIEQPYEFDSTAALDLLATSPFFSRLDRAVRAEIAEDLSMVNLIAGQVLFREGDPGDSMYIVESGLLEVHTKAADGHEILLDRLDARSSVGEMALLTGRPRSADVVAVVDSRLLKVSKTGFDKLIERHPPIASGFSLAITPRVQRLHLAGILNQLLGDIDAMTLHAIQEQLIWRRLQIGETLFRQGEIGNSMFIVVTGRLQVILEGDEGSDNERKINEIGPSEIVGEFALLVDDVRSATVYALRQTDLVEMTRPVFESLNRDHPQIMFEITRLIVERQKQAIRISADERPYGLTMAVFPAGQEPFSLEDFAGRLKESLSHYGPTIEYTSQSYDGAIGRAGMSQLELDDPLSIVANDWIQDQERQFRHILFVADVEWSNWSQRCLAHADVILLVGRPGTDSTPGRMEKACHPRTRQELVLIHPTGTTIPSGTMEWRETRSVVTHHHVREDDPAHWQRLARRLTGRTVGAVFSGGAARGLAHIGAIQALMEADQPVDVIAGTSMGAFIGGGWAMGLTPEDGITMAKRMANPDYLLDRTLPYTSVMASRKITRVMQEVFGEIKIEDLWRPFFCVSTNLSNASPVVHDSGLLWRAVRASISLPGVFSPILNENNELLVDGGVMNNFPVDIMAGRDRFGLIIGSNVSPRQDQPYPHTFGESISGWQVVFSRLNPFGKSIHVPTLVGTILRTVEVNSLYRRKIADQLVDISIEPDVRDFNFLNFAAYETIINRGYEAGQVALQEWAPNKTTEVAANTMER